MINHYIYRYLCWTLVLFYCTSCSISKGLQPGESYYVGSELIIDDPVNVASVENLEKELNEIPSRGTSFGLLNLSLGLYNIYDQTGDGGFKHWVKYKLGREPIKYDDNILKVLQAKIDYYLKRKGLFNSTVSCTDIRDEWKTKVACNIRLGERSQIDSLIFPSDSTYLDLELDEIDKRAIIQEGSYYDVDKLTYERARLSKIARDKGFADFGEDDIIFYVDTLAGESKVDVYLQLLNPSDSTFHTKYNLNEIHVYPNHELGEADTSNLTTRKIDDHVYIHEDLPYVDDWLIKRMISEIPGESYSATRERNTINRLLNLGLFSFINIQNQTQSSGRLGAIKQNIFLTPQRFQSISGEWEVNSRSGNFVGTGLSINYSHLNLFGGAEQLLISLGGQVEAQLGEGLSLINTYDISLDGELTFPKFIVPFIKVKESNRFIPRTIINLNFSLQRRVEFYSLRSAVLRYGFRWKENLRKLHELYPIYLNVVREFDQTGEFEDILDGDERLNSSFENATIIGLQYFYTYNNQSNRSDLDYNYFELELETSGNFLGLFSKSQPESPSNILGRELAQYVKLTLDYRRYVGFKSGQLAMRALIGGGYSYGNSDELPYIKQYLIGGSNSLRAFRLRGLGPGRYVLDPELQDDPVQLQFLDQTGDLKLEFNIEYRFPLISYLKGAIFMDAGNVWLLDNEDRPEGNFSFRNFYEEIGIGTGLGLRLDFDFFLLRLDLAFPLRAPVYQEGFDWRFDDIDFSSSSWRRDNLRYNLGIGYPF